MNETLKTRLMSLVLASVAMGACLLAAAEPVLLWEIGSRDNDTQDLALGRDRYAEFSEDPFFVVGQSDAAAVWPYCHPGPQDAWAGNRQHAFTIVFGLATVPTEPSKLILDFADAHPGAPPVMRVDVNGHQTDLRLRGGAGDAAIFGDVSQARETVHELPVPPDHLRAGANRIAITSVGGSWALYDWIGFEAPAGTQVTPIEGATALVVAQTGGVLTRDGAGALFQPIKVNVIHLGEPRDVQLAIEGLEQRQVSLEAGTHWVDLLAPAVGQPRSLKIALLHNGEVLDQMETLLEPVRKWEVHILHHTHLDIGYTHVQTEVMTRQWEHLEKAIELARATRDYPEGARFKWLPEGLWAVDGYLGQASGEQRNALIEAVKNGSIGLDALYGHELTALCRPEELLELTYCARNLSQKYGLTIDTAMITDVPGYTWGIVPVLAQSGVRYFGIGPNRGHRIGFTLSEWGDKPSYWVSPSGRERILFWVAGEGYSLFHDAPMRDGSRILASLERLEAKNYPYDITYIRYNIGGDNGPPDEGLCDFVRDWNETYAYPKLIISTPRECFEAFEQRYGSQLPEIRGDFTPYWEDGAASSARETAINRASAERLVQANALWAMLRDPADYPAERFHDAWRDVVLYDEHTWGAHNSITEPESDFVKQQWAIKQAFALEGERKSGALLDEACDVVRAAGATVEAVRVFNTCSWERTGMVTVPAKGLPEGDLLAHRGNREITPSQRLSNGDFVFIARKVPPFGSVDYRIEKASGYSIKHNMRIEGATLENRELALTVDSESGTIASLRKTLGRFQDEYVDDAAEAGLGAYIYVEGRDPANRKPAGPATLTVKENGPVMVSLLMESSAPGCRSLKREVRLIQDVPYAELIVTMDRENVYNQEAVHLAFPFSVAGSTIRIDTPWAPVEVEKDQLKGACKNYLTVQRWVDVSNDDFGVTLAPIDAPLIEIGKITNDPRVVGWREVIEPSSLVYSYAMNNYWETNYKASQEGVTTFRYAVLPHDGSFKEDRAMRFGVEASQPLVAVPVKPGGPAPEPFLRVKPEHVLVTNLKPSDDGTGWIARLYAASTEPQTARLGGKVTSFGEMHGSNLNEEAQTALQDVVGVPPQGMVTVRVNRD
ncbi:MAG TPA: polysaccharide lyase family protein [Candidatus Hydrogenedentes bacterium]|nr:polysaccharide lyase family protein [Candidatus Hydrogenedentota bacterium]HQH52849.1 polysaccharide lyase family protein [Candidatus Hydrogenedentota bacterium]HQM50703.1 polysaccharide lyase family protein [Candidatus Hydrogenedentota bacterium]